MLMSRELQDRILVATNGTKTGAIIRCALERNEDAGLPQFVGKAIVTSDGFVMCDFIDADNVGHHGAFVGSLEQLDAAIRNLQRHMQLNAAEYNALCAVVTGWIETDYRGAGA